MRPARSEEGEWLRPPVTPRASGSLPLGSRLAKSPHAARRAAPCRSHACCLRSSQRSEVVSTRYASARRTCSLIDAHSAKPLRASMRPPIPLKGGFERALKHNARGLYELGFAKLAAAARIVRAMFKCPLQRAKTHAERCGHRPRSCSSPARPLLCPHRSRVAGRPVRPPSGAPEEARSRAAAARRRAASAPIAQSRACHGRCRPDARRVDLMPDAFSRG